MDWAENTYDRIVVEAFIQPYYENKNLRYTLSVLRRDNSSANNTSAPVALLSLKRTNAFSICFICLQSLSVAFSLPFSSLKKRSLYKFSTMCGSVAGSFFWFLHEYASVLKPSVGHRIISQNFWALPLFSCYLSSPLRPLYFFVSSHYLSHPTLVIIDRKIVR